MPSFSGRRQTSPVSLTLTHSHSHILSISPSLISLSLSLSLSLPLSLSLSPPPPPLSLSLSLSLISPLQVQLTGTSHALLRTIHRRHVDSWVLCGRQQIKCTALCLHCAQFITGKLQGRRTEYGHYGIDVPLFAPGTPLINKTH